MKTKFKYYIYAEGANTDIVKVPKKRQALYIDSIMQGPFDTFTDAKRALKDYIKDSLDIWRYAHAQAVALKEKDVIVHEHSYEVVD